MVRAQVQLPTEIYARARKLAEAKEISFAELARRGLELILGQYPAPQDVRKAWEPPVVEGLGWRGLTHQELKDAAQETAAELRLREESTRLAGL